MMTEMDKKINEFKCVSFKEIYLRTKIVNELKFMYTRYRNELDCDYSPIGPILKKEDSDYLEKLRKEFVEIIFKRDDLKKEIIKEYKKFCEELKNLSFRNNFFENKNICVGRLSKSIKAFTTRYLQIVINYSGIEKNIPSNKSGLKSIRKQSDFFPLL